MSEEIKKNAENINDLAEKVVGGASGSILTSLEVTYNVCCGRCNTVLYSFTAARGGAMSQLVPKFCPNCNSLQHVYIEEAN